MRKILDPKSPQMQTATLRAKLRRLMVEHHEEIAAIDIESFDVREAWALSADRVKVHAELKLKDGSHRSFTRTVPFTLPPEMKTSYRDWTIITKPTYYGYRYQLLDGSGAAAGESDSDLIEVQHVEQNARREIDRQIVERIKTPAQSTELATRNDAGSALALPNIIEREGAKTTERFLEYFTVNIPNKNTREAYARGVAQFLEWCDRPGVTLATIRPMVVAAYVEKIKKERSPSTVKQHLSAIRMLFDWMVIGQAVPFNPASSVRGPRYSIKKGKTPVLSREDMRKLLDSIDISNVVGLRDRALIGLMVYSFARVSAVVNMKVGDYYQNGKRWWIRLHEKGGKFHEVPVHHLAEEYLDAYIEAAGIAEGKNTSLFRTTRARTRILTENGLNRVETWKMIKRRALEAGLSVTTTCHTFRATGITAYLENGGTIEHAQQIAAHESPRTTKLYDRTSDAISLDEIERIVI